MGAISNPDLIKLLYDSIADPVGLKNKNNEIIDVSKSTASKILNRTANVRNDICEHSQDIPVLNSIHSYFQKHLIAKLNPELHDRLIQQLIDAINGDNTMIKAEKTRLLKNADVDHITDFLISVFLYTLSIPNKSPNEKGNIGMTKKQRYETDNDGNTKISHITSSNHDIIKQGTFKNLAPPLSILSEITAKVTEGIPEKTVASAHAMIGPVNKVEDYLASLFVNSKSINSSIHSLCNVPYYHLVVTCSEIFGERYVDISLERGLRYSGTSSEIIERCADLSDDGVKELLSYPAIICNENTKYRGDTDKNQLVIIAKITRIRKNKDVYRIRYYPIASFPQSKLNEYAVDFGFSTSGTLTTLNTSHWSVIKNNLHEILEDTDIKFSRYLLLYKSSILHSKIPDNQSELLITDLDKLHIGSYQTIYPSMWTYPLEDDHVYRITTEFSFNERYIDGKRTIILSATWNNIIISGNMTFDNCTSERDIKNCIAAEKKIMTAIFKVLNYKTNNIQFLLVFEVK